MSTVKEDLLAAKSMFETRGMTLNQSVDNTAGSGDAGDEAYEAMMTALKAALPQVPPVNLSIVRWSHRASRTEILALFNRAIAAQDGK